MAEINLSKYGITGTTEIVYNPSYEMLFERRDETLSGKDMKKDRSPSWAQ